MRIKIAIITLLLAILPQYVSSAATQNHIHSLAFIQGKLYLATHHGLFKYVNNKNAIPIGPEFDIMGMAVNKDVIYASGHPSQEKTRKDSVLLNSENPVGLLLSKDKGRTWQKISLEGEADFHTLTSKGMMIIGVDSSTKTLYIK